MNDGLHNRHRILHTKYLLDSRRSWWHHAIRPLRKNLEVHYLNAESSTSRYGFGADCLSNAGLFFQCSSGLFLCLLVSCQKNVACSFWNALSNWWIVHIANLTSLLISCCREYGEAKLRRLSALATISKFLDKLGFDLLKHADIRCFKIF